VGFFSPLAGEPGTRYRVRFAFKGRVPTPGRTGISVTEYHRFLWIDEQFTRSLSEAHRTGIRQGIRLRGSSDWTEQEFSFTTSARTRMIHLVLFREGPDSRSPVLFDDITVEPAPAD